MSTTSCADESDVGLGDELNVVRSGFRAAQPQCPKCGVAGPMRVYEHGVRWACGGIRPLPPLYKEKLKVTKIQRKTAAVEKQTRRMAA